MCVCVFRCTCASVCASPKPAPPPPSRLQTLSHLELCTPHKYTKAILAVPMTWKMANFSPHQPAMSVFYVYRSGSCKTYSIIGNRQLPAGHGHHHAPRSSWQRLPHLVLCTPYEYTKPILAIPMTWKMANFSPHQLAMSVFYVYRSGSCKTYSIIFKLQLPNRQRHRGACGKDCQNCYYVHQTNTLNLPWPFP